MGKLDDAYNALNVCNQSTEIWDEELLVYYTLLRIWEFKGFPKELPNVDEDIDENVSLSMIEIRRLLYSLIGRGLLKAESGLKSRPLDNVTVVTLKRKIEKVEEPKPTESATDDIVEIDKVNVVIQYLNRLSGFTYKEDTKSHRKYIERMFKEGYELEDFQKVIAYKVKDWGSTDMRKFLRPSTLFAPSHFEEYLQEAKHAQPAQTKQRNMNKGAR